MSKMDLPQLWVLRRQLKLPDDTKIDVEALAQGGHVFYIPPRPMPLLKRAAIALAVTALAAVAAFILATLPGCGTLPRDPMATAEAGLRLLQCVEPVVSDLQRAREAEAAADAGAK